MITGQKEFNTLDEANAWGKMIAAEMEWEYKGAATGFNGQNVTFRAIWKY
jgi:hypothetical protein